MKGKQTQPDIVNQRTDNTMVAPKGKPDTVNQRTNNTMVKPKGATRYRKSKDRQRNQIP